MGEPIFSQPLQRGGRNRHVAVLGALAAMNMHQSAGGVDVAGGSLTLNEKINTHRLNNEAMEDEALLPDHRVITKYAYNSLNQLVWQLTPDGGETRFAYDPLGRIIASQNAKQLANETYKQIDMSSFLCIYSTNIEIIETF